MYLYGINTLISQIERPLLVCHIVVDDVCDKLDGWINRLRTAIFPNHTEQFGRGTTKGFKYRLYGLNETFQHENVIDRLLSILDIRLGRNNDQLVVLAYEEWRQQSTYTCEKLFNILE